MRPPRTHYLPIMHHRATLPALLGLLASACGGPRWEARPDPAVPASVTQRGELIYVGRVFELDAPATRPTYVYERRVDDRGAELVSTHVTRTPEGTIQLAESATHAPDYALTEYTLHANQLGQSGSVRVKDGEVFFALREEGRERTAVERVDAPVVVGPTLVGFVVRSLPALGRGERVDVRLAVLDRLETIGFELRASEGSEGLTEVTMVPSSFLFRLVLDPITFTFDTATRNLVRLEGRVPPKIRAGARWADLDARVEYELVAGRYL